MVGVVGWPGGGGRGAGNTGQHTCVEALRRCAAHAAAQARGAGISCAAPNAAAAVAACRCCCRCLALYTPCWHAGLAASLAAMPAAPADASGPHAALLPAAHNLPCSCHSNRHTATPTSPMPSVL
jgi:hypothetical protein